MRLRGFASRGLATCAIFVGVAVVTEAERRTPAIILLAALLAFVAAVAVLGRRAGVGAVTGRAVGHVAKRVRGALRTRRAIGVALRAQLGRNGLTGFRWGGATVAYDADTSAIRRLLVLTTRDAATRARYVVVFAGAAIVRDTDLVRTAAVVRIVETRSREQPEKSGRYNEAVKSLQTNVMIRKPLRFLKQTRI